MIHIIVNPNSRSKKGAVIWEQIKALLDEKKTEYCAHITEHIGHAMEIAGSLTKDGHPVSLIVMGGDGTLNEVVSGLHLNTPVTLGYIPTGSGNDFARSMKLSADPKEALERILTPRYFRTLDCGVLTFQKNGREEQRRFVVSSGLGFDAAVCHNMAVSKAKRVLHALHLGKLVYAAIGLKQVFLLKHCDGELMVDGAKKVPLKKISFVSAHIQQYEGGGFPFAPDASCEDGLLDLCVIFGASRLKFALILIASMFRLHTRFREVEIIRCRKACLKTDQERPAHADGENCGFQKELQFTCMPACIRIIAPAAVSCQQGPHMLS